MFNLLFLLFILFPPSFAKPIFNFSGDTLIITVKTQNPSMSAKLVYGELRSIFDFNFDGSITSRITDTLHEFKLIDIEPEKIYLFKIAFLDTVRKTYYSTQNYFLKTKRRSNNELKEGISFDVWPYLSLIDSRTVGIAFYTNRPSKAILYVNDKVVYDTLMNVRHEFIVPNLRSGVNEYKIKIFDENDTTISPTFTFILPKKRWRIGVFGDTRGNPSHLNPVFYVDGVNEEIARRVMRSLYEEKVNVVFVSGDLITGRMKEIEYAEEEYKSFLKACWPYVSFIPVNPIPGNHDMIAPVVEDDEKRYNPPPPNSAENLWAKVFVLPENGPESPEGMPPYKENVYYVILGDMVIYALNSDYNYVLYKKKPNPQTRFPDEIQRDWLKDVVAKNKKAKHKVLIFHEPIIGLGFYERGNRSPEADSFANFIKDLGFKYYISGHDHMYAKGVLFNGLVQIVSAGGGAPLYDLKNLNNEDITIHKWAKTFNYLVLEKGKFGKIKITAKNLVGEIIDQFEVK